jgi:hypothetical protein
MRSVLGRPHVKPQRFILAGRKSKIHEQVRLAAGKFNQSPVAVTRATSFEWSSAERFVSRSPPLGATRPSVEKQSVLRLKANLYAVGEMRKRQQKKTNIPNALTTCEVSAGGWAYLAYLVWGSLAYGAVGRECNSTP